MSTETDRAGDAPGATMKPRLTPPEASAYLSAQHGLTVAPGQLSKLRVNGRGPAFRKFGKRVLYDLVSLDAWAAARLGTEVRSTTEQRGAA